MTMRLGAVGELDVDRALQKQGGHYLTHGDVEKIIQRRTLRKSTFSFELRKVVSFLPQPGQKITIDITSKGTKVKGTFLGFVRNSQGHLYVAVKVDEKKEPASVPIDPIGRIYRVGELGQNELQITINSNKDDPRSGVQRTLFIEKFD